MSERNVRDDWGQQKRDQIKKVKMVVAVAVLVVAVPIVVFTEGVAQYFGVGLGSVATWRLFPDSHGVIGGVVDRLPFLKSKPKESPDEEES